MEFQQKLKEASAYLIRRIAEFKELKVPKQEKDLVEELLGFSFLWIQQLDGDSYKLNPIEESALMGLLDIITVYKEESDNE